MFHFFLALFVVLFVVGPIIYYICCVIGATMNLCWQAVWYSPLRYVFLMSLAVLVGLPLVTEVTLLGSFGYAMATGVVVFALAEGSPKAKKVFRVVALCGVAGVIMASLGVSGYTIELLAVIAIIAGGLWMASSAERNGGHDNEWYR